MTTDRSTVTIHMVSSLDGYIVKRDGSVDWLETSDYYEAGVDHGDDEATLESIDCYVIGARTYEQTLEIGWPYGEKTTFVVTHQEFPNSRKNVCFRSGDLTRLINDELRPKYKSIWVCGGAKLVKDVLRLKLADELCKTIAPIIIGDGLPFFDQVGVENKLHLKDVKAYKSGFVELTYQVVTDELRSNNLNTGRENK